MNADLQTCPVFMEEKYSRPSFLLHLMAYSPAIVTLLRLKAINSCQIKSKEYPTSIKEELILLSYIYNEHVLCPA
jgi:hypothetical protein